MGEEVGSPELDGLAAGLCYEKMMTFGNVDRIFSMEIPQIWQKKSHSLQFFFGNRNFSSRSSPPVAVGLKTVSIIGGKNRHLFTKPVRFFGW